MNQAFPRAATRTRSSTRPCRGCSPYVEQDNLQRLSTTPPRRPAPRTRPRRRRVCRCSSARATRHGQVESRRRPTSAPTTSPTTAAGTVGFGLIASGDGLFAQTPVRIADITDGTSNTAAFSESLLGNGAVPADRRPSEARFLVLEVPGGNDPTPAACDAAPGAWSAKRGGQVDRRALRQHALQPLLHAEPDEVGLRQRQPQQGALDGAESPHRRR